MECYTELYKIQHSWCTECTVHFMYSVYYQGVLPVPQEFTQWTQWSIDTKCLAVLTAHPSYGVSVNQMECTKECSSQETATKRTKECSSQETAMGIQGRKCNCPPIYALGFYEIIQTTSSSRTGMRNTPTLFLTQFCVHPDYRGRGLLYFIVCQITRSMPQTTVAIFWSLYPTNLKPTLVTRRFAVKLTEYAGGSPKVDGLFVSNTSLIEQILDKDKFNISPIEYTKKHALCSEDIKIWDADIITRFINLFTANWKYSKLLKLDNMKAMISAQFSNLFKVVAIYSNKGSSATSGEQRHLVGVFCLKILAIRAAERVKRTALLAHIAWDGSVGGGEGEKEGGEKGG